MLPFEKIAIVGANLDFWHLAEFSALFLNSPAVRSHQYTKAPSGLFIPSDVKSPLGGG